ncbi:hypothetical protein D9613_006057 [Agrocybe pediades]|uniref:Uncharacterized protein n=1 Tax=Agrocybe pediades TaxID=84607 RepID=A0A8H4QU64_9AGAR|nr:hypothetical protein D9613_006057 [Agrocybe pediades]KAF9565675.1 hypothetical protein CPC08DRAFT_704378 [Agrocybe pediades]
MVQGKTKGLQAKTGSSRHASKAAANTKKGRRAIPPKKPILVKQAAMQKELSAKINHSIERQMVSAASSGPLTIMKSALPAGSTSGAKTKSKPAK